MTSGRRDGVRVAAPCGSIIGGATGGSGLCPARRDGIRRGRSQTCPRLGVCEHRKSVVLYQRYVVLLFTSATMACSRRALRTPGARCRAVRLGARRDAGPVQTIVMDAGPYELAVTMTIPPALPGPLLVDIVPDGAPLPETFEVRLTRYGSPFPENRRRC